MFSSETFFVMAILFFQCYVSISTSKKGHGEVSTHRKAAVGTSLPLADCLSQYSSPLPLFVRFHSESLLPCLTTTASEVPTY